MSSKHGVSSLPLGFSTTVGPRPRLIASVARRGRLPQRGRVVVESRACRVSTTVIVGWIISLVGTGLWFHGYFVAGGPSLIDWHAISPWWIADFLPNVESEIGMTACFIS